MVHNGHVIYHEHYVFSEIGTGSNNICIAFVVYALIYFFSITWHLQDNTDQHKI